MTFDIHHGMCLDVLKTFPDNSFDSIVTDPPYGISFMGKKWDYDVPSVEEWAECLRVLKPGGHLLAFAGTRTQHRTAVRIEDAGFEIRDMIAWVYGSGFPKSLDVSKAIDKAAGVGREVVCENPNHRAVSGVGYEGVYQGWGTGAAVITAPATEDAKKWQGWRTALKPAMEPITVARKPLTGTVAANVLEWGTGAINIDGCRVEPTGESRERVSEASQDRRYTEAGGTNFAALPGTRGGAPEGRWPANLIHDGSEEVAGIFPNSKDGGAGSAARFFYCAKTSKKDRGDGNDHPTVKPTDLMAYLCRLVTPPGGVVLDPFMGSGSTGKAAIPEGFHFIGVECEPAYFGIACRRIEQAHAQGQLFEPTQAAPVQLGLEAA